MNVSDFFDDPDFVGLVGQHYATAGDERVPSGEPILHTRAFWNLHTLQGTADYASQHPDRYEVFPVFKRPAAASTAADTLPRCGCTVNAAEADPDSYPCPCGPHCAECTPHE